MTVSRLLADTDSAELTEWIAFYRVKAEAEAASRQPAGKGAWWPASST